MTQVFLTNASTSPWLFPASGIVAGHTVEMLGAGGQGAAGTTGASGNGGGGGGGGTYSQFVYQSGAVIPGATTIPFGVPAGGSAVSPSWGSATVSNCYTTGSGGNASGVTGGAGGAGPGVTGTPPVLYTAISAFPG